ncbi:MAG: hypothetical protein ACE5JS_17355 [Nitrospinota bacterium]
MKSRLISCVFLVSLVASLLITGAVHAFEVATIDQFVVIKNGAVFLNDTFGDGVPPPSSEATFPGGAPASYIARGVFDESGGKLTMDSLDGFPSFGLAGVILDDPILTHFGRFFTNINPANLTLGLKIDDSIEIRGLFDLTELQKQASFYEIRFTDFLSLGNPGNDIMLHGVFKATLGPFAGQNIVRFTGANFVTGGITVFGATPLDPNHDQILFILERPGNSAADRRVFARFAYVDGGSIDISDDANLAGLTFIDLSPPPSLPATIFKAKTSRAQSFAS